MLQSLFLSRIMSLGYLVCLALITTGCVNWLPADDRIKDFQPKREALESRYFDVNILTHDGVKLRATVYQPKLRPGETAPLIIHSHGFAVFRMSGPMSMYGQMMYAGRAALNAWHNGYWVISYDHRGHGGSDGTIRVMHPEYEVRDVSNVIDWAEKNINRLTFRDRDPVVGMIGESYGGNAALLGSTVDERIDAIVPITTWYDLETSLYPNRVPKTGWLTSLVLTANTLNPGNVDPVLNKAYLQAIRGDIDPEIFEYLYDHHPKYVCDRNAAPTADTLLIQGFRDVLFPLNEGVNNLRCIERTSQDVRFIGTQGGHLLPLAQFSWVPAYSLEDEVHCGDQTFNLIDTALHWFDEKLKRVPNAAADIPKVCLTLNEDEGVVLNDIPRGGQPFQFNQVNLSSGMTGFFETILSPVDSLSSMVVWQQKEQAALKNKDGGFFRPRFEPLYVAKSNDAVVGIPTVNLQLSSTNDAKDPPIIFMGIGLRRAGTTSVNLINDQIIPVKAAGQHAFDLPAVSSALEPGDTIGIVIQGYSDQYRLMNTGITTNAAISGTIHLPIVSRSESIASTPNIRAPLATHHSIE